MTEFSRFSLQFSLVQLALFGSPLLAQTPPAPTAPSAAPTGSAPATAIFSINCTSDGFRQISLENGVLTYTWNSANPGDTPDARGTAVGDVHKFSAVLTEPEIQQFRAWAKFYQIADLPVVFPPNPSIGPGTVRHYTLTYQNGPRLNTVQWDGSIGADPSAIVINSASGILEQLCQNLLRDRTPPRVFFMEQRLIHGLIFQFILTDDDKAQIVLENTQSLPVFVPSPENIFLKKFADTPVTLTVNWRKKDNHSTEQKFDSMDFSSGGKPFENQPDMIVAPNSLAVIGFDVSKWQGIFPKEISRGGTPDHTWEYRLTLRLALPQTPISGAPSDPYGTIVTPWKSFSDLPPPAVPNTGPAQ